MQTESTDQNWVKLIFLDGCQTRKLGGRGEEGREGGEEMLYRCENEDGKIRKEEKAWTKKRLQHSFFLLLLLLLPPRQSGHMCFPAHLLLLLLFLPSPAHIRGPFGCAGRNVRCPASRWAYVPHENSSAGRPAKHYGCTHAWVGGGCFPQRKRKEKKPKELSQILPDRERGSSLGRVKRIRGIEKVGCPNFRKGGKCLLGFARTPIPTPPLPCRFS